MLRHIPLDHVLFLDIETVSQTAQFTELQDDIQTLWKQKGAYYARRQGEEWTAEIAAQLYEQKAAIFAEFGKIIVISVGFMYQGDDGMSMKVKSFASDDEGSVLRGLSDLLTNHFNNPEMHYLCGHNIREFDIPYLCRRMIVNRMPLPDMINVTGKKPWETEHFLDTMTLWKFGDYKSFTSLNLLAHLLGIPTPKDDIDGSEVGRVYWQENDLQRIAAYCEKDVVTVGQLLLRFQGLELIPEDRIFSVTEETG